MSNFPNNFQDQQKNTKLTPFTLGIWIPQVYLGKISAEGIYRLLAFIVAGMGKIEEVKIKIFCVSWLKDEFFRMFESLFMDISHVEFITITESPHLLVRIINSLIIANRRNEQLTSCRTIYPGHRARASSVLLKNLSSWISLLRGKITNRGHLIVGKIGGWELLSLVNKGNNDVEIDAWFFPFPRGKDVDAVNKPAVVAAPDIVFLDFPTRFVLVEPLMVPVVNEIIHAIKSADRVVCYSNYVKNEHIVNRGFKDNLSVTVIPHAPMKLDHLLDNGHAKGNVLQESASEIINSYIVENYEMDPEIYENVCNIHWNKADFFFVSSQNRPHKNMLNLAKVFKRLLRQNNLISRLVFTGAFDIETKHFIEQNHLENNILSLRHLPPMVHAAFYKCASLTIVPTLFEGGFPFVFSESVSLGTPVVLSRIPVVTEVCDENEPFLFDPYDQEDMQRVIQWGFLNQKELLSKQIELLRNMESRTWDMVANDYYKVFRGAAARR